jgi:hypothetical protein
MTHPIPQIWVFRLFRSELEHFGQQFLRRSRPSDEELDRRGEQS